jgi:O-succinylbenzoic acid--CoA ligase
MARLDVDWLSEDSHAFINPLLPEVTRTLLKCAVDAHSTLKKHIWLCSSGTESFPKMIALSKRAILASAAGVNSHLKIRREDSWLNILPLFHTGGLAIHARAFLTKSEVWDFSEEKWDPKRYVDLLDQYRIAFSYKLCPTREYLGQYQARL